MIGIFVFIFGVMIGSFLNVLIYRIPRELNFVSTRSQCPQCKKLIFWYENIPILSYIFLRGKCSKCKARISIRYPLIELLTGVVAVFLLPTHYSMNAPLIYTFYFSVFCVFLVHFFIDLEFKILPNLLNLYLALVFGGYSILMHDYKFILLGALIGVGFPAAVSWIFYKIKGEIGLGMGDIKLYGALGLFLGPMGIIQNIFLSCFLGSIIGLLLIVTKQMNKSSAIPFGPFIIIVSFFQIFFPDMYKMLMTYILVR
jgi:prepilin signal peptidase PulO-like enzyme (type II secretory pathway)